MTATETIDIRPAASRPVTRLDWLESHHCFSFGPHNDPGNVAHGLLIVSNDDVVAPGRGFGTHQHNDMEIVTWVLEGELEHRDSAGNAGVIVPGLAQRMSAGTGILHSEMNHSATEPVHFVQMWVMPDVTGIEPGYEQLEIGDRLDDGGLVAVASGRGHEGAVGIHQEGAVMWVSRIDAGGQVDLPDAPFVHLYVARGEVELVDIGLTTGDAARLHDAGSLMVTATAASEIIVWESDEMASR
jgi:redox-sensitive bicupin YhaK (pirin superfamily)